MTTTTKHDTMTAAERRKLVERRQVAKGERIRQTDEPKGTGPDWARGCGNCQYGWVGVQHDNGPLPLYAMRAMLAAEGVIAFCDCRAGHMARQHARRVYADVRDGKDNFDAAQRRVREWIEKNTMPTFRAGD